MNTRLSFVKAEMDAKNLDGLLISDKTNRIYISGFTGSSATIFLSKNQETIITDFRYLEQTKSQAADFKVIDHQNHPISTLASVIKMDNIQTLGIEAEYMNVNQYLDLKEALPDVQIIPVYNLVEKLRAIKDPVEIERMKIAAQITDQAFDYFLNIIQPGMTELEVAAKLDNRMRELGASDRAFETIVASGWRTSLPHGHASAKIINQNELITVDFGAVYQYYYSDMTRTISLGKVPSQLKEIYEIVKQSQEAGISEITSTKTCKEIDSVCRQMIEDAGYGKYFGHGTGHGIGLSCHEFPYLNQTTDLKLSPGMVVTIEPGIYIPNLGGIRIEDDVLVCSEKPGEVLTKSTKEWLEL